MNKDYDVVIVGGGPAGSTAAAVLAMHGRRVAVIEKEPFPRYSVGESLIPYTYFSLARLGVLDKLKSTGFVEKHSVQFISKSGRASQPFYFRDHFEHDASRTWQVNRAKFDSLLLDNARDKGAEVFQPMRVKGFIQEGNRVTGVTAATDTEELRFNAPVTIDASGRSALAASRRHWRVPDANLNKVAIWTYYEGAKRDTGIDEGATTIAYIDRRGWFWHIPLADDRVSVGVVADKEFLYKDSRDPATIFQREVQSNAWLVEHLAGGHQVGEYQVTGDFSYRAEHCADDGLVLIGDAFAFLDPVFSSGLFFALFSGELAADAVHAALDKGPVTASCFDDYGERFCAVINAMRRLVYAFYDEQFSFGAFIAKYPALQGPITDCLIGNLTGDLEPLFTAFDESLAPPAPCCHGMPVGYAEP